MMLVAETFRRRSTRTPILSAEFRPPHSPPPPSSADWAMSVEATACPKTRCCHSQARCLLLGHNARQRHGGEFFDQPAPPALHEPPITRRRLRRESGSPDVVRPSNL